MKNHSTPWIKLIPILVLSLSCFFVNGQEQNSMGTDSVPYTISDPISVDSLFIQPAMPREGQNISLFVSTTHESSPCGLLDYQVVPSATNQIFITARYWRGPNKAICNSYDKLELGKLKTGYYTLNFMNKRKIEFTVYAPDTCKPNFTWVYPKCGDSKCINTVSFIDQSKGSPTKWKWDFGDSTYSYEQNPSHYYKDSGIYKVCLSILCGPSKCAMIYDCFTRPICKLVPVGVPCKAKYTYEILPDMVMWPVDSSSFAPYPSYLVKFTDISVGPAVKWLWNFGDGSISEEQNPIHRFKAGRYIVTLAITTDYGCESKYSDTLVFANPPFCQYTGTVKDYSKSYGCKFVIELDNGIVLEPVSVPDSFILRHNQRVILDYVPVKCMSVCMTGITAKITCIREIPSSGCKADFEYVRDMYVKCLNCAVFYFTDKSIGNVTSWQWDFGDGTTSTAQNPSHTYLLSTDSMRYIVCLTIATSDGCTSTYCDTLFVGEKVPWIPVIGGDDNHSIMVSKYLKSNIPIEIGDYIGLFFRDYWGNLVCGGMIRWTEKNDVLIAWANTKQIDTVIIMNSSIYPVPRMKNGFNPGEKFEFKIWKYRSNEEILIQNAQFTVNYLFPDSGYFKVDGLSLLSGITTSHKQQITLHDGWNLVSLNVKPENPSMSSIFGDLKVIVKNYKGEIVYFPQMDIKETAWNMYEGYKVKSFEKVLLGVSGDQIDPLTVIPLNANKLPYFLPYYYNRCYPIKQMMFSITNNIRYVQTIEYFGNIPYALNYIPRWGIDQIKYMKPGLAYKLSLFIPMRSFSYPPVSATTDTITSNLDLTKPAPVYRFENNRVLVIQKSVLPIPSGAEVSAFTSSGIKVGSIVADGNNVGLSMWDVPELPAYDDFVLSIDNSGVVTDYKLSFSENTTQDEDLYILEKVTGVRNITQGNIKVKAYPTVVSEELNINVTLDKASIIEVYIFDLLGHKVGGYQYKNTTQGDNKIKVHMGTLTPGQYIYKVKTKTAIVSGKVQVTR